MPELGAAPVKIVIVVVDIFVAGKVSYCPYCVLLMHSRYYSIMSHSDNRPFRPLHPTDPIRCVLPYSYPELETLQHFEFAIYRTICGGFNGSRVEQAKVQNTISCCLLWVILCLATHAQETFPALSLWVGVSHANMTVSSVFGQNKADPCCWPLPGLIEHIVFCVVGRVTRKHDTCCSALSNFYSDTHTHTPMKADVYLEILCVAVCHLLSYGNESYRAGTVQLQRLVRAHAFQFNSLATI